MYQLDHFLIVIDKYIVDEINRLITIARKDDFSPSCIQNVLSGSFGKIYIYKMPILQDADCSGRTLATLLVAWVTTAMVASILLHWEYIWIILAILTVFFLLVCGYTAYKVKRTHARLLLEQQRRAAIRTVSSITAINRRQMESMYPTHLHTDLPPSYASVVTMQTTTSTTSPRTPDEDKYEDPPSYSIVIASLDNSQNRNAEISSESNVPFKFTKNRVANVAAATSASTSLACPHGRLPT